MKTIILICYFSFLSFHSFSQKKNIYLSIEGGLGYSYGNIIDDGGDIYDDFKIKQDASNRFGLNIRYDFSEKFSAIAGCLINGHINGVDYSSANEELSMSLLKFQKHLYIPFRFQNNFRISSKRPLFCYVLTGLSPGFSIISSVFEEKHSFSSNSPEDMLNEIIVPASDENNLFALNALLGFGFEKERKSKSRWGLRIILNAGLLKTFENKYRVIQLDQPIPESEYFSAYDIYINQDNPDGLVGDISYISKNTSIFLTFYYAFNLRKKKNVKEE